MNRSFRNAFYDFFYYSGITRNLLNSHQRQRKVILTYHNVLPLKEMSPYYTNYVDVSKDTFEFQLKNLVKNFKIQPASKIVDPLCSGIFLSFDDGMSNNMDIILPILTLYGITAMFGVCTGLLNGDIEFIWRDRIFLLLQSLLNKKLIFPDLPAFSNREINAANLNGSASAITNFIQTQQKMDTVYQYLEDIENQNNFKIENNMTSRLRYVPMNLEEVKSLSSSGHFVVSHTHTHRKLSFLSEDQILFELKTSRDYLSKNIGDCNTFVYPYGTGAEVNHIVKELVKTTGYEHAFMNCNNHLNDELYIPRINMGNNNSLPRFYGVSAGLNKIFK